MLRIFNEGINDISNLNTYIIGFKSVDISEDLKIIIHNGGLLKYYYDSINTISVKLPDDLAEFIKGMPNVRYIVRDENANITINGFPSTNEISPIVEEIPWGISKIRAPEVWSTGNKGTGIKVCIIDTGIDYNHPDLSVNYKGGYNFLNDTNDPMDDCGHGTHVAGIIAANGAMKGVTPEAYIYSCKVLNECGGTNVYEGVIAAIQWSIDNGINVINMSLGGPNYNQGFNDICYAAYNAGIVIAASAGNGGAGRDTCGYPARYNSCIGIAATDINDNRASFSSEGPAVEVSAPGKDILSTVPTSGCSCSNTTRRYCDSSGYKKLSGTSMASPHVSGTAALIFKAHPNFTNKNVRGVLTQGVVHLGDAGRNHIFGFGRIDAKMCVDITNPPNPPAFMQGSTCVNLECRTMDAKVDECSVKCDCPSDGFKWCCDSEHYFLNCYLNLHPPQPGCPGASDCYDDLMDCKDYCSGNVTCPNPTISFGLT